MNETDFVTKRKDDWARLLHLARSAEGTRQMKPDEALEFIQLYRSCTRDLARARSETANEGLINSLNVSVGIAYSTLYRRPRTAWRNELSSLLKLGAQAFRRQFWAVLLALGIFVCGIITSSQLLAHRPDLRSHVVSPQEEELFDAWKQGKFEERSFADSSSMWSFYATNNPRVSAIAASIGPATFGLGSAFIMWKTGIQIGALSWDMQSVHKLGFLVSSLVPHGASELSGAIIAAASGFVFAGGLINPGRRRRLEALVEEGKDGFVLMMMGIIMMYVAAPFEAYFSFNPRFSQELKVIVAVVVFAAWCAYWILAGRSTSADSEMPALGEKKQAIGQGS